MLNSSPSALPPVARSPEVTHRVHDEAQKISERLRDQYGILDIGVPAIRELRGELPE